MDPKQQNGPSSHPQTRAGQLANTLFLKSRFRCEAWIGAELPVTAGFAHHVLFDTASHTAYCSCSFYPRPCVHAQALAQLWTLEGERVFDPVDALPEWAAALRHGLPVQSDPKHTAAAQREAAREQRHFERLERAARGFEDLEAWLLDTLRRGIATAVSEDPTFFEGIATRLADASMRSMSRALRLLASLPGSAPDWTEQLLSTLADAALATQAFQRRAQLPEALIADLEAYIGIALKKDAVLASGMLVQDAWAVTGVLEEPVEDKLRVRRTWLMGGRSGRFALLLDYAFGDESFDTSFKAGMLLDGALRFYPSAWPQRALPADPLRLLPKKVEKLPGYTRFADLQRAYAAALGVQPWLEFFPAVLNDVTPYVYQQRIALADIDQKTLPLTHPESLSGWALLALSGGRPLTLFGQWNGNGFRVLSAIQEGRVVEF